MSILLIRHGETLLNASRTLQPEATSLSPRGQAQARALGARLADAGIQAIVSSDLPRAQQTAAAISRACGIPVLDEALLQERNFGELRGLSYDGLGFDPLSMTTAPPGGESAALFRERIARAFARLVDLRAALSGNLAVITHGLVIGRILEAHAQLASGMVKPRFGNASVTILAAQPPHGVSLLDCRAHLAGALEDDAGSLSGG